MASSIRHTIIRIKDTQMFQLRILLLAAAIMALIVQPASASRQDTRILVHLAAQMVATAALMDTLATLPQCDGLGHASRNPAVDPVSEFINGFTAGRTADSPVESAVGFGGDVATGAVNHSPTNIHSGAVESSVDRILTRVMADLPSLYLDATLRSVVAAISPFAVDVTAESCRTRLRKFTREHARLGDEWDREVDRLKSQPGGDIAAIRKLDADLIGSSVAEKSRVFAQIDLLGMQYASAFARALNSDAPLGLSPAILDQKYF